jgi:hypothetical protein
MIIASDPLESNVRGWLDGELRTPNWGAAMMYQRDECIAQASICREKARADPARYDHWIDQSVVWLQRAVQARRGKAVTYDIREGRMIPRSVQ